MNCIQKKTVSLSGFSESEWYAAYTLPNNEKKVYQELLKRGEEAYLPTHKVLRQWKDRKKQLNVPLFPNYVFLKTAKFNLWPMLEIYGLVRYVTFNGKPAVIPEKEIEAIKQVMSLDMRINEVSREETCMIGERVRIMQGPLLGLEGVVVSRKDKKRLLIGFRTINQTISVDVSVDFLEKVA